MQRLRPWNARCGCCGWRQRCFSSVHIGNHQKMMYYIYMVYIYIFVFVFIYIYTYTCVYMYTCKYLYTCIYVYMDVYINTYIYIYICIWIFIYIYIYTYVYEYTFVYISIHIHVYEYFCIPRDPITFWEWSFNLNAMLRRWLDTPIILWQYERMPKVYTKMAAAGCKFCTFEKSYLEAATPESAYISTRIRVYQRYINTRIWVYQHQNPGISDTFVWLQRWPHSVFP